MKCMILAAGLGSRMRPLTDVTPKPLLEVAGKPLIVWHIENLAKSGFQDIVINIAHLGYKIPDALGDGSKWGVRLHYSDEQEEGGLESAGGIIKALPILGDETFLVVNGDVWCDYSFNVNFKLKDDALAHLILVHNPSHNVDGDFSIEDGKVIDKKEFTFSGIGYYSPKLFTDVAYGKSPLAPLLRAKMQSKLVTGELYDGEWYDIGTPQRLEFINKKYRDFKQ